MDRWRLVGRLRGRLLMGPCEPPCVASAARRCRARSAWIGRVRGSVVRAPFEHRCGRGPRPGAVTMRTRGLSVTRVAASEHRSSTGTATCDRQRTLSVACVQGKARYGCAAREANPEPAD